MINDTYVNKRLAQGVPSHLEYLHMNGVQLMGADQLGTGVYFAKNNGSIRGFRIGPDSRVSENEEGVVLNDVDVFKVKLGEGQPSVEMLEDRSLELSHFLNFGMEGVFEPKEEGGLRDIADKFLEAAA